MSSSSARGPVASRAADDALGALYRANQRDVVRLAWLLLGDAGTAEEVVHDVFVSLHRRLRRGDVDDPRAYLRRAVVNACRSRLRRRYLEARHRHRNPTPATRGVRRVDDAAADRDAVFRAMRTLPQGMRTVLVLRFFEDLSVRQVADLLDVTTGSVKSQTARGLAKLRAELGQHAEVSP